MAKADSGRQIPDSSEQNLNRGRVAIQTGESALEKMLRIYGRKAPFESGDSSDTVVLLNIVQAAEYSGFTKHQLYNFIATRKLTLYFAAFKGESSEGLQKIGWLSPIELDKLKDDADGRIEESTLRILREHLDSLLKKNKAVSVSISENDGEYDAEVYMNGNLKFKSTDTNGKRLLIEVIEKVKTL